MQTSNFKKFYDAIPTKKEKRQFRKEFNLVSDIQNPTIYCYCVYGAKPETDRTIQKLIADCIFKIAQKLQPQLIPLLVPEKVEEIIADDNL